MLLTSGIPCIVVYSATCLVTSEATLGEPPLGGPHALGHCLARDGLRRLRSGNAFRVETWGEEAPSGMADMEASHSKRRETRLVVVQCSESIGSCDGGKRLFGDQQVSLS